MIHFNFPSVVMTVLVCNLLLILISLFFNKAELLIKIGYKAMVVACVVTLARLLLPCELPFTRSVILPAAISDVISLFRFRHETGLGISISFIDVLLVAWLAGSILFLCRLIWTQGKLRAVVRFNSSDVTGQEPYTSILRALCSEEECGRFQLYLSPFGGTPMIIGLRKPIILLPQITESTEQDLMYALRHELYHYRHHDLWLKFFVGCLAAVYWWNPFCCRLLTKQIGALLEIRVDAAIVSEGDEVASGYISALIHYQQCAKEHNTLSSQFMGLTFQGDSSLARRIHMMQNRNHKPNYLISAALLLLVFGMYIGSYLVVFESSSYGRDIKESKTYILPENTDNYAIPNADGTYTVYILDGKCIEIVDSLECYYGIKVYSSKEEHDETVQKDQ